MHPAAGATAAGGCEGAQSVGEARFAPSHLSEELLKPRCEALQDGFEMLRFAFRCRKAHRSVITRRSMRRGLRPSVGARQVAVAASGRAAWSL